MAQGVQVPIYQILGSQDFQTEVYHAGIHGPSGIVLIDILRPLPTSVSTTEGSPFVQHPSEYRNCPGAMSSDFGQIRAGGKDSKSLMFLIWQTYFMTSQAPCPVIRMMIKTKRMAVRWTTFLEETSTLLSAIILMVQVYNYKVSIPETINTIPNIETLRTSFFGTLEP